MIRNALGRYAASGIRAIQLKRILGWLWNAWIEAEREIPLLRWLGLAAVAVTGLAIYLAASQGHSALEISLFAVIPLIFALIISAIVSLLFAIYRKHRSDAIFDSRRLNDLIRKLAQEEIQAREEALLAPKKLFLMEQHAGASRP